MAINTNRIGINVFTLKMIAVTSMLVDHIGAALYPDAVWMRMIGRLAFPIYAFLLCEGYRHTRDIKRYALRLGVFALVSEIPYNLLQGWSIFYLDSQNVFLTLFIGLLTLYFYNKYGGYDERSDSRRLLSGMLIPLAGMCVAQFLRADYGSFGVFLIFILHICRDNRKNAALALIASNLFFGIMNVVMGYAPIQALAGLSAIPLYAYNEKKGPSFKYAFYLIYPAHILIIMAVKYVFFGAHPPGVF